MGRSGARVRGLTRTVLAAALSGACLVHPAAAQDTDEPAFGDLLDAVKSGPISLGALLQIVADFQPERTLPGSNGFSVANARVSLGGALDGGFDYFLQAALTGSPSLLDARVGWAPGPVRIDAGRFKVPFSREFLTGAASIDFVNRARVVQALAPGRQIGLQLARVASEGLSWAGGIFSGPSGDNPSGFLLGSGRVAWAGPATADGARVLAGFNAAYGGTGVIDGVPGVPALEGTRLLGGADVRMTSGRLLLSAETIGARLTTDGAPNREVWGLHLTGGWSVAPRSQLLARWDRLDAGPGPDDQLVLGYNLWPTAATEVQVNYVIPVDQSLDNHQLLVNFQVAF